MSEDRAWSGPFGIALEDIEVSNLYIPSLGGANAVGRLFAIGTYGAQGQEQFAAESPLDRWFFCVSRTRFRLCSLCPLCLSVCGAVNDNMRTQNNEWWRQEGDFVQKIQTGGTAATFTNLRFSNWTVRPPLSKRFSCICNPQL